jgi:hypothetical protein
VTFDWKENAQFKTDTRMEIPNSGDVVDNILIRIVWPNSSNVNISVGTAMIQMVELLYEDVVIERIYGENMYIMNDIMVPQGKRDALTQLTGMDTTTSLTEYYVLIPFTMKIPLCALDRNPTIRLILNQASSFMSIPYSGILNLKLVVDYVFLSDEEKLYMQTNPMIYTTRFYQMLQFTIRPSETVFNIITSFIGNVKELYWLIKDPSTSLYNYRNDLVSLGITFNGVEYLSPFIGTSTYLHKIQPLEYHTKIPTSNVYVYSFSLNPEMNIPNGEVNLTNIMNQMHSFVVTPYSSTRDVRIYASTYNQATVSNGSISVKYTLSEAGFKN